MKNTSDHLQAFRQLYAHLNKETLSLSLLKNVYAEEVTFIDPFHRFKGLSQLHGYFENLYDNVTQIDFHFSDAIQQDDSAVQAWKMIYKHPKLNKGKEISLEGVSQLAWQGSGINYHRDFFDAGQLLYEHIPVIGWAIRKIKGRMS